MLSTVLDENEQAIDVALECLRRTHRHQKSGLFFALTKDQPNYNDFSQQVVYEKLKTEIERWKREKFKGARAVQELTAIRDAWETKGEKGVEAQVTYMLQERLVNLDFSRPDFLHNTRLADLRYPYEWYPETRTMQREIHLHIGPTNSGKTYHALKRLEQAHSGVYAGPLRLLAREVYARFHAQGKKCNLITGDEVIMDTELDATLSSCTVEMAPCHTPLDVAIIDEIQMISNPDRGFAWTQALLGIQAKEVHLCGEERALDLVQRLVAAMGEKLIIHRYKRLNPLKTMSISLKSNLRNLEKGDCVVAFSKRTIHDLKNKIQMTLNKRVAVVYGSLPPQVRAEQARLFNDPLNDYDILVASDAVGLGLNLCVVCRLGHCI